MILGIIGTGELLLILAVALILFGGKRLPELAKSLGQGVREFKKACNGLSDDDTLDIQAEKHPVKDQAENSKKDGNTTY